MTTATTQVTGDYVIDPAHSTVGFTARHAMVTKVRGSFGRYEGKFHLDFENPAASSAELSIDVESIDTKNEQRDGHLRTNDFFDAPSFPKITFTSTSVEKVDDENYKMTGDLTIKGIAKPVTIDWEFAGLAQDPFGNTRAGFEGKVVVSRSDWGISFNAALETGGVLVNEKVTLEFDISAIKQ